MIKQGTVEEMLRDMEHGVYDCTINGKCSNCGGCCANFLPMTSGEANRIRQYIKQHGIKEQVHVTAPMAQVDFDATCPFRDNANKRCVIYDVRPQICRDFQCDKPKKRDYQTYTEQYKRGVRIVFMRETFFQEVE